MIAMAAVVWLTAVAQDPSDAPPTRRARAVRVHSDVHILIEETPKEEFEFDYYEQLRPVEYRSGTPGLSSGVWFRTVCRPQEDDRVPIFLRPDPPPSIPLRITAAISLPKLSVTASRRSSRSDVPATTPSSPKPAIFGGGGSTPHQLLDVPLSRTRLRPSSPRISAWNPDAMAARGRRRSICMRGRSSARSRCSTRRPASRCTGSARASDPAREIGSLEFDLTVSAGPAFLHTGISATPSGSTAASGFAWSTSSRRPSRSWPRPRRISTSRRPSRSSARS